MRPVACRARMPSPNLSVAAVRREGPRSRLSPHWWDSNCGRDDCAMQLPSGGRSPTPWESSSGTGYGDILIYSPALMIWMTRGLSSRASHTPMVRRLRQTRSLIERSTNCCVAPLRRHRASTERNGREPTPETVQGRMPRVRGREIGIQAMRTRKGRMMRGRGVRGRKIRTWAMRARKIRMMRSRVTGTRIRPGRIRTTDGKTTPRIDPRDEGDNPIARSTSAAHQDRATGRGGGEGEKGRENPPGGGPGGTRGTTPLRVLLLPHIRIEPRDEGDSPAPCPYPAAKQPYGSSVQLLARSEPACG